MTASHYCNHIDKDMISFRWDEMKFAEVKMTKNVSETGQAVVMGRFSESSWKHAVHYGFLLQAHSAVVPYIHCNVGFGTIV